MHGCTGPPHGERGIGIRRLVYKGVGMNAFDDKSDRALETPDMVADVTRPLRVGLLAGSRIEADYLGRLVAQLRGEPRLQLVAVSWQAHTTAVEASPAAAGRMLLRTIRSLETRLQLPSSERRPVGCAGGLAAMADETIELPVPTTVLLRPEPAHWPMGVAAPEWADRLRAASLDLLVACGHRGPNPQLLATVTLGMLSVEHDGETAEPAGLAGFPQVLARQPATGFTVRWHQSDGGESQVVAAGEVWNRYAFLLNQSGLHRKSLHYLAKLLRRAADRRTVNPIGNVDQCSTRAGNPPRTRELARYLLRYCLTVAGRLLVRQFPSMEPRWTIFYSAVDWKQLDIERADRIDNPPGSFLADPFLLEQDGKTYCFVEELSFSDWRGCISAYELVPGHARRIGKVIVEPFHMSFPFLFRHGPNVYMVPETSENRDIRVYRCLGTPDRWALEAVLMSGLQAMDTMLFEHEGRWWMMTNLDPAIGDGCSELHLFHADSPLSTDWTPHPCNPVVVDTGRARNAGLLRQGRVLYRVAQRQAFNTYGSDFSVNRIDLLDTDRYRETPADLSFGRSSGTPSRVHHLCSVGGFTVFDRCV